jgi:hypothetical protein
VAPHTAKIHTLITLGFAIAPKRLFFSSGSTARELRGGPRYLAMIIDQKNPYRAEIAAHDLLRALFRKNFSANHERRGGAA